MQVLKTVVTVKKCPHPEKGPEVNIADNCLADCDHFLHMGYDGGIPVITCIFPRYKSVALMEAQKKDKPVEAILTE